MGPKMGQPKLDNPNSIKLSIRINALLNDRLERYCKKYSLSKGEVIRKGIEKILAESENKK